LTVLIVAAATMNSAIMALPRSSYMALSSAEASSTLLLTRRFGSTLGDQFVRR
jgi:hypothetical protein